MTEPSALVQGREVSRGGSTHCCRPLVAQMQKQAGLSRVRGLDSSSGASRKRRVWGGNPNKIPAEQNERLAKFGIGAESCSKNVAASLNTFRAASGDFAKAAGIFSPLIPTKPKKAKWTQKTGNLFLISYFGVPFYVAAIIQFSFGYNSTN